MPLPEKVQTSVKCGLMEKLRGRSILEAVDVVDAVGVQHDAAGLAVAAFALDAFADIERESLGLVFLDHHRAGVNADGQFLPAVCSA